MGKGVGRGGRGVSVILGRASGKGVGRGKEAIIKGGCNCLESGVRVLL